MLKFRLLISFLALLLIGLSSCQSSKEISREEAPAPCKDKLYLELQKRDSTTYSDFEKKYFLEKQKECRDALIKTADKKEHDEKQAIGEKIVLGVVVAGGVFLVVLLYFGLAGWGN